MITKFFSQKTFRTRKSSNLIDFNSPPAHHHDYINDHKDEFTDAAIDNVFGEGAVGGSFLDSTPTTNASNSINTSDPFQLSTEIQRSQLVTENWYHGCISRAEAEELLKRDGDFLVRESKGSKQFCLSGMQGTPRHLLLIDPHGQIRTKDMIFESISHLINFHFSNSLPIIVSDVGSALLLRYPIDKRLTTTTPRTPTTPTSPGVFFKTK
jgi:SHC-transforming protein 1